MILVLNAIRYEQLTRDLLDAFPELNKRYLDLVDEVGNPGPDIFLGGLLFTGYVVTLAESKLSQDRLTDAFSFLERLVTSGDDRVVTAAVVNVLEYLSGFGYLGRIWDQLGPVSSRIALETAERLGHPLPGEEDVYEHVDLQIYEALFRDEVIRRGGPSTITGAEASDIRNELLKRARNT